MNSRERPEIATILDRRRAALLEDLTFLSDEPLVGVVGLPRVPDLIGIARGMRRHRAGWSMRDDPTVACFYRQRSTEDSRIEGLRDQLTEYDRRPKHRRKHPPMPLSAMVEWYGQGRGAPHGWRDAVTRLAGESTVRMGLIFHYGMRRMDESEVLRPLVTDRTVLVYDSPETILVQEAIRGLRAEGYGVAELPAAGLAIASLKMHWKK